MNDKPSERAAQAIKSNVLVAIDCFEYEGAEKVAMRIAREIVKDFIEPERELGVAAGLAEAAEHPRSRDHNCMDSCGCGWKAELPTENWPDHIRSLGGDWLPKHDALTRGMALEQAAQQCEGYEDGKPPDPESGPDTWDWHAEDYARAVRSLDPDAAQALAAHDEEIIGDFVVKHGMSINCVCPDEMKAHDAEIERCTAEMLGKVDSILRIVREPARQASLLASAMYLSIGSILSRSWSGRRAAAPSAGGDSE